MLEREQELIKWFKLFYEMAKKESIENNCALDWERIYTLTATTTSIDIKDVKILCPRMLVISLENKQ